MDALPDDIICKIASFFKYDVISLYAMSGTCEGWHYLLSDKPKVWHFSRDIVHTSQISSLADVYIRARFYVRREYNWLSSRNKFYIIDLWGLLFSIKEKNNTYIIYDWNDQPITTIQKLTKVYSNEILYTQTLVHGQSYVKCTKSRKTCYFNVVTSKSRLNASQPQCRNGKYYLHFQGRPVIASCHNLRFDNTICFTRRNKSKSLPNYFLDFDASQITLIDALLIAMSTFK